MTGAVHPRTRPIRDRETVFAYASLGLLGWFVYGFGASLTLLRDDQGLTRVTASVLSAALAIGGITGSLGAARFVERWGRGALLRTGALLVAAGTTIYISGGPLWWTALGPFLGSLGAGISAVGASAFLEARQGAAADAAITEGNVVASVTSLLATFAVGVAATTVLGWRAGMALLVVMAIALEVARGRRLAAFDVGTQAERIAPRSRLPSLMWWAILTLILLTSVELTLLQWGADLLRERGGLGAAAASASISAIVTGMILGRLVGSRIVERISGERVFAGAIILAAVGFLFTLLVAGPLVMILGFLITGSGIGMHFPLGISRAMRASAGQPDRAAGLTSAGIGIVSGIAPFFLAALADAWGIRTAFAVMLACFVVSFILLLAKPVPEEQVSGPSATRSPQ